MGKISAEAEKMMIERFGKDTVIALATVEHAAPHVKCLLREWLVLHYYICAF